MPASLIFLASYLIGAIPFGVIAAKICGVDLFKIGSGSTGTTNVIRACGKRWGLVVLILDLLKGTAATLLGLMFFTNNWLIVACGALAMIGHSYSVFIKFRGGKAAATGIGVLLALNWKLFLIIAVGTILIRQISGYQSLASLGGSGLAVILFLYFKQPIEYSALVILGSVFVWLKHLANIKRLLQGTESKIVKKGKR